jgi:hypothetical protein
MSIKLTNAYEVAKTSATALLKNHESYIDRSDDESQLLKSVKGWDNKEFAKRAIISAKAGHSFVAVNDLALNSEWLNSLGFEHFKAVRRDAYIKWMSESIESSIIELGQRADDMLALCHSLSHVNDADFLHRNPILSIVESLWKKNEITAENGIDKLIFSIISDQRVDSKWVYANSSLFQIVLTLFLRVKTLQSELKVVIWENSFIPEGYDETMLVLWRLASENIGSDTALNAKVLNWYSEHWLATCKCLKKQIEVYANRGEFTVDIEFLFSENKWLMSIPINEDRFWENEELHTCSPILISNELRMAGYFVKIFRSTKSNTEDHLDEVKLNKATTANKHPQTYIIRIQWFKKIAEHEEDISDEEIEEEIKKEKEVAVAVVLKVEKDEDEDEDVNNE